MGVWKALGKMMQPATLGLAAQKGPGLPLLCVKTGLGRPWQKQQSKFGSCLAGRAQEPGIQGAGPERTQSSRGEGSENGMGKE